MMEKSRSWWGEWRSALAWTYVIICLYDFCIGPIIFNVLEYWNPGQKISGWQSITLQNGGIIHISLGSIIGISSHGRTQETIATMTNNTEQK